MKKEMPKGKHKMPSGKMMKDKEMKKMMESVKPSKKAKKSNKK